MIFVMERVCRSVVFIKAIGNKQETIFLIVLEVS